MPRITISYRRDDSMDITGRIFDRLALHFGRDAVFRDIDSIPPGVDFRRHVEAVLDASDIILAIVGSRWVGPSPKQSRITTATDPVRLEIEIALAKEKPLIPVLVSRAEMPNPEQLPESLHDFPYLNAVTVDGGKDFDVHIHRLIRGIKQTLGAQRKETARKATGLHFPRRTLWIVGGLFFCASITAIGWHSISPPPRVPAALEPSQQLQSQLGIAANNYDVTVSDEAGFEKAMTVPALRAELERTLGKKLDDDTLRAMARHAHDEAAYWLSYKEGIEKKMSGLQ